MRNCGIVVFLLASALSASWAEAQDLSLSAVAVNADHELLGARLVGGAARFVFPVGNRVRLFVGGERASGRSFRTGIPCGGFYDPHSGCVTESLRDDGTLSTGEGGVDVRLLAADGFVLRASGDIRLGLVSATTTGLTSGRTLSATKAVRGADVGVDAFWSPWPERPLSIDAGVRYGGLTPLVNEQILDGYTPFDSAFRTTRVSIGLSWRNSRL